jgi:hypothetical protein
MTLFGFMVTCTAPLTRFKMQFLRRAKASQR